MTHPSHRGRATRRLLGVATSAALLAAAAIPSATAAPNNNTSKKLRAAVTADGQLEHMRALQAIADANGDTRVSGSPGYDESVTYAAEVFADAGYVVDVQEFQFQTFVTLSPTVVERVAPAPAGPVATTIASYSGSGDVTAPVSPTADVGSGSEGCQAGDFAGFTAGDVALIRRGGCTFATKATNAEAAGASAVVIANNTAGAPNFTLGSTFTLDLPVVGVTQELGDELAGTEGLVLRVRTQTFRGIATTSNVIAESTTGDPENVVMAGAHLDSVNAGPGINDNGSGSAAILEIAEQMAKVKPKNRVRFALWGAEESGLVGSTHYVAGLDETELDRIAAYLNYDMIGSPNYVRFVYDGDDSDGVGAGPGPAGSDAIERLYTDYFAGEGLASEGTDFSGRSDYGPFIAEGIPSGGLFTGAEGEKTADQARVYGGVAGESYDPCYHQFCDALDYDHLGDDDLASTYATLAGRFRMAGNVNLTAQEEMGDAAAHAILTLAFDTSAVNGEGRGRPVSPPGQAVPGTPGAGQDGSGGGLHDGDHDHEPEVS